MSVMANKKIMFTQKLPEEEPEQRREGQTVRDCWIHFDIISQLIFDLEGSCSLRFHDDRLVGQDRYFRCGP